MNELVKAEERLTMQERLCSCNQRILIRIHVISLRDACGKSLERAVDLLNPVSAVSPPFIFASHDTALQKPFRSVMWPSTRSRLLIFRGYACFSAFSSDCLKRRPSSSNQSARNLTTSRSYVLAYSTAVIAKRSRA